jgi:hypothetical protein
MRSLHKVIGEAFLLLFWGALVLCGIECTREEVRRRRYVGDLDLPDQDGFEPSDTLTKAAERELADADSRRRIVDDKARMLLILVGLLIPITATLASRLTSPVLVLVPLVCFLFAALILVGYLDIGVGMRPKLTSEDAFLEKTQLQQQVIVDVLSSARTTEQETDFLVDVYRAGIRALLVGLVLVVAVVSVGYSRSSDPTDRLIQQLRSDPALIRELRGPQGAPGEQGPSGPQGPQGIQGRPGPQGPRASQAPPGSPPVPPKQQKQSSSRRKTP